MCYDISHNTNCPFRVLVIRSLDDDLIVVENGEEGEHFVEIISDYIVEEVVFTSRLYMQMGLKLLHSHWVTCWRRDGKNKK